MDNSLFRWFNRLANRTGWAHGFFTTFADFGIAIFAVLLLSAYLIGRKRDVLRIIAGSVWAGAAALVALGIGQIIGGAIDRLRPYEAMTGVHVLVDKTTDFSIPSDHATAAGAVAVGLFLAHRRVGVIAVFAALLMAFTRVYVGAHYPGDVVAGLALGGLVAVVGHKLFVPALTTLAQRLQTTTLRPLVCAGRSAAIVATASDASAAPLKPVMDS